MNAACVLALGALTACGGDLEPESEPANGLPAPDCVAPALQNWVGQSIEDVNLGLLPRNQRVFPRGAPVTTDYSPQRVNVETDPRNNRILRVYCG